ncbi:MAG: DNA polymerase III subunit delta [Porticoccaceae bacterium]
MLLRPERLGSHLERTLAPVYLVSGDEPLLIQEAGDAIRTKARQSGFSERVLFHADDKSFDWQQVLVEANSLSLFADKKILEIRLNSGKPGDQGSKVIQAYCTAPAATNLLILITPKLDKTAQGNKWFKALNTAGVVVQIWPVTSEEMPRWMGERLRQAGIRASGEAIKILAERVEGNLLAAMQEIEKLKLLAPTGEVSGTVISTLVSDSARYNVFALMDRILDGDSAASVRILRGLRDEDTEATALLWALTRELRALIEVAEAAARGEGIDAAFARLRVWDKRKPLVRKALHRVTPAKLGLLLRQAGAIDRAVKGLRNASVWDELTALALALSGANSLAVGNLRLILRDGRD